MAYGEDHVPLGGELDAEEGIALPIGGQSVIENHQREGGALYPRGIGIALRHVVSGGFPLVIGDGHMDGLAQAFRHVPGHIAGPVHARNGFLLHRVIDPDRNASFGSGRS